MKIIDNENQIKDKISQLKKNNFKIVMCHGVFDVIHYGHILHFEEAKKMGDKLIISVTSDRFVNKGLNRPFFDLNVRMSTLAALDMVDYIIPSDFPTAIKNIKMIKPDIYCKGPDYLNNKDLTGNLDQELQILKINKGQIKFTNTQQYSSSSIINNMSRNLEDDQKKFVKKIKDKYSFKELENFLNQAKKLEVNIIGEPILDEYSMCEPIGISSKDPFLVFKKIVKFFFAGGSLAIANNISNYLKKVNLLVVTADKSNFFDKLRLKIQKNVKIKVIKDPNYTDVVKNRYIDVNSKVKLIGIYELGHKQLATNSDDKIKKYILQNKKSNFIIADYGHGLISKSIAKFISKSKVKYILNAQLNSSNRGHHSLLKFSNPEVVIINESELRYELRNQNANLNLLINQLRAKIKAKSIIVTRGKSGAILSSKKNKYFDCPAFNTKVVDKVGAGDALLAIFSICKFANIPDEVSMFFASLCAASQIETMNNEKFIKKNELLKNIYHLIK
jgi:rfaE bifunctional protein nucleotidyltransferase chain/domain